MSTMTVPGQRQVSQAALDQILEPFEGLELRAYLCPAKVWTIGYGHTGRDVVPGMVITARRAVELLDLDIAYFEKAVDKCIGNTATTQAEFDAMVILAYNIGMGSRRLGKSGFETSSVLRFHLLGNKQKAAESFAMWKKGGGRILPGLVRRRAAEAAWYRLP